MHKQNGWQFADGISKSFLGYCLAEMSRGVIDNTTTLLTLGKFDWGVRYVIIFLFVQFWIRLGVVSYYSKEVQTAASLVVRSVNKSRDTRNCVQNEPEYAICVIFTTRLYYKALGIILCHLMANTPQLQSSWRWLLWRYRSPRDFSAGMAGAMVTIHVNFVNVWSFKGPKLFCVL